MTDTAIRWSLWLACPFNLVAAGVFAFPSSAIGRQLGLPEQVSPLYSWLVALFVALFGIAYAWLAQRPSIDRPMLALGSIGKLGAFLVALSLWLEAAVPGLIVLVALGDLAFATLWFGWLYNGRGKRAA
jgi:hypothetical protein